MSSGLIYAIVKLLIGKYNNYKIFENVFKQAAKYPRVLRALYEVYMPVIEYLGEKAIVALLCIPLVDKDSVCTYETISNCINIY